jgi:hypothetical protein
MLDVLHGHPCELAADVRDAVECARSAPVCGRRAEDEERVMWRGADTEARDLKSNASIATICARSNDWLLKGAESLALRALATALRVWRDSGGAHDGTDEIFTIRLLARPVNAEMRTGFVGHHISATFELRGGGVKAVARRVECSESLDDAEHSSILIMTMADFGRETIEKYVEKYDAFRDRSAARSRVITRVHSAPRSEQASTSIPVRTSGVSNPPGRGRGRYRVQTGGLLTPPLTARAASPE